MQTYLALMLTAVCLCVTAACSDEDTNNDPTIIPGNDASDVAEPMDAVSDIQDPDAENGPGDACSGTDCPDGSDGPNGDTCEGDTCDSHPVTQCDSPIQAGQLTAEEPLTVDGQLPPDAPNEVATACGSDEEGSERIVQFSVSTGLQVTVETTTGGSLDVVTEARGNWCRPSDAPAGEESRHCADGDLSFYAPAGSTWNLVVEQSAGIGGDFDLTISGETACSFGGVGDWSCSESTTSQCVRNQDGDIVSSDFSCPTTCGNSRCRGETCAAPIVIDQSMTVSGNSDAFTGKFELAKSEPTCTVNGEKVTSDAEDLIFLIPSTSAGETIQLDVSPSQAESGFYSFITRNCPGNPTPVTCGPESPWSGDGEFVVPENGGGDYYLVIDRVTSGDFTFDFTRQGP